MLQAFDAIFQVFYIVLFVWIILSWVRPEYGSWLWDVQQALNNLMDPILAPIRQVMPTGGMGIDFSPIVLLILMRILSNMLHSSFG